MYQYICEIDSIVQNNYVIVFSCSAWVQLMIEKRVKNLVTRFF